MNIAQFSKISGVSVSTLHFYDKLGLFSPSKKNDHNGYREYIIEQLYELNKILILKDSGIKLETIKKLLNTQPDISDLTTLLEENMSTLEKEVADRKNRIQRIQTNLFLLKNGGIPAMNEIIVKHIEPIQALSLRRSYRKNNPTQSFDDFSEEIWQDLEKTIEKHQATLTTPCMTCYYEGLFLDQENQQIDLEIVEPLNKPLSITASEEARVITLPAQKVVSAIHNGDLTGIGEVFDNMMLWIEKNKYTVEGPVREIYHRVDTTEGTENENRLTELQIPLVD